MHDLTVSRVEGWINETRRNMKNGFKACLRNIREQYESDLREALGENRKPILQLKGWQARSARSLLLITSRPDEHWTEDLTHVWCDKDRRAGLAAINY